MLIRGQIDHTHTSTIDSRRGPVALTSTWIVDRHDHSVTPTKQPPTMYEVQYLDDKLHRWADTIAREFTAGDHVLAVVRDDLETASSTSAGGAARTWIKARGTDLAHSTLHIARA